MATIRKLANGKWQTQVARQGVRKSKTFDKKADATDWGNRQEHLIVAGEIGGSPVKKTFADLLRRYAKEVCPSHKGGRWEILRIEAFCRDPMAQALLSDLTPDMLARWRDKRQKEVKGSSVKREMQIISGALNVARKEWGWIKVNPLSDVRRPKGSNARDRRVWPDEIEKIIAAAGDNYIKTSPRVGLAFLFAIETAMRAGEICALHSGDINHGTRVATLHDTKNGKGRKVPLSSKAIEIIRILEGLPPTNGPLWRMTPANLSATFMKIRKKTDIKDLTFHDTRHEAITRLAKKMDILALARMVGHSDIRQLQTYYNETAEELAKLLD
ncbi:site-specific integrase [Thalassospira sp.]|uniref:tyrosine-type recombinase/integrase n=1 Tax=Thalassospira sp. TaxID=1912094 RepID=UPI001B0F6EB3|nr:site-specific integrase [Thalassospira sp.]MBO6808471.1 site-specific integrase [Thalassospira sp.]MBO6839831.1 site-specific integrase [Thalassospira sp.]